MLTRGRDLDPLMPPWHLARRRTQAHLCEGHHQGAQGNSLLQGIIYKEFFITIITKEVFFITIIYKEFFIAIIYKEFFCALVQSAAHHKGTPYYNSILYYKRHMKITN